MGYTNYFTVSDKFTEFSKQFLAEVHQIIKLSGVKIVGWDETFYTEPEITSTSIALNGFQNDGCETFCIHPITSEEPEWYFCKTRERPYDLVVKAILIRAKVHGYVTKWSDDDNSRRTAAYRKARELADNAALDVAEAEEREEITMYGLGKEISGLKDRIVDLIQETADRVARSKTGNPDRLSEKLYNILAKQLIGKPW